MTNSALFVAYRFRVSSFYSRRLIRILYIVTSPFVNNAVQQELRGDHLARHRLLAHYR